MQIISAKWFWSSECRKWLFSVLIWDLKIRRQRRQQKVSRFFLRKTTPHEQHTFFVHFSVVTEWMKKDVKMPNFTFYGERKQATTKFSFTFRTWIWFLGGDSTPGEFAYNWQSKRVGINAVKAGRTRIHFLSNAFAAVTVRPRIFRSLLLKTSLRECPAHLNLSNRPHSLWVYWRDNPPGMLGEHSKSL